MKNTVIRLLSQAVSASTIPAVAGESLLDWIRVERTRDSSHGDFACNLALKLARTLAQNPRALAEEIVAAMSASQLDSACIRKVEVAGPGFINFYFKPEAYHNLIRHIQAHANEYGSSDVGHDQRIMVEFVSTNPTGPLHVGHGRGAAFGDALVRVLRAVGYDTHSEYYINDAGRQMDILALSVWIRYLDLCGRDVVFPANAYQGEYVRDIAGRLRQLKDDACCTETDGLFDDLPEDVEQSIDRLIQRCQQILGPTDYATVFDLACDSMVEDIRQDLEEFGVLFDEWFSERSLQDRGDIRQAISTLKGNGHIFEREGALWFRATDFGDEKDRVVVRANGAHTYFASDIAYHYNKAERGFDRIINIFGADHHGYIKRIDASFEALGNDPDRLQFLLVQFAVLYRGRQKISMSTRDGQFVTLRELREEIGNDAARFFYVLRKPDQHMEFDLELAKSRSSDNPVYYIQYAHARICSVFRQLDEKGMSPPGDATDYSLLTESREMDLLVALSRFPEVVELAAISYEPHQVAYYLRDLAHAFHTYYNAYPFLGSEDELRQARLGLIDATRIVLANGLAMLDVTAPERM